MYFFKSAPGSLAEHCLSTLGGGKQPKRSLWNALTGEEHPRALWESVFVLVLLLHVKAALWFMQPAPKITQAKPLMMEVSLVSAPAEKVTAAPPKAEPPPPPKKEVKPVKKKKPVTHKPIVQAKPEPTDLLMPAPAKTESVPDVSKAVASNTQAKASAAKATTQTVTQASPANYASNPAPEYPSSARSRGWEGKVVLRVRVSRDGDSEEVSVLHSSGHELLDEAAVEAVERWKFTPGKRGDEAIASTVNVPIIFTLNN